MSRKNDFFRQVPVKTPKRNFFDLSHEVKLSGKFGYLYPILLQEALPGDTFKNDSTIMVRFAPMLAPIMHKCDVTTHFFFVPNRLLWDNWESFITGGQDGTESPVPPYITAPGIDEDGDPAVCFGKGTLWDYFGGPIYETGLIDSTQTISVLPFYAYAKIFNDYYIDPNLDNPVVMHPDLDGNVSTASPGFWSQSLWEVRRRGWEKDYFTAALPWTQRGAEVLMPIQGTGTVTYTPTTWVYQQDGGTPPANTPLQTDSSIPRNLNDGTEDVRVHNIDEVIIDNSEVSLNDLRRTIALQHWLEVNARGGHRYNEQIFGHFGVHVPDSRLQRAEYLGGGKQPVTISEVVATANSDYGASTEVQPLGDMAGHGISVGRSNHFRYTCLEHGFIVGIMSVTFKTAYQQGLDKMWFRTDRFDYAWPEFASIGEQEIYSKELYFSWNQANATANNGVFGYIPRYSEYKFKNDRVAGDFRDTLRFWHLGRYFQARPELSPEFTTLYEDGGESEEETSRRIFYVQDGTDYLWCSVYHNFGVVRPLPYFGVPGIGTI